MKNTGGNKYIFQKSTNLMGKCICISEVKLPILIHSFRLKDNHCQATT